MGELVALGEQNRQLLARINDTAMPIPDVCLHQLVEQQAQRTPTGAAVEYAGHCLAYRDLDQQADQLAARLRAAGVGPGNLVAVCLPRSSRLVVALLAVLKAGAAYVPLDPHYPAARLQYMVTDSRPVLVLGESGSVDWLSQPEQPVWCLDTQTGPAHMPASAGGSASGPATPDDLAYVIYTSGSTGQPKGVMISHRAAVNHMIWMQARFPLDSSDAVLQKTPISFDASVWEFFAPLIAGARLVMAPAQAHRDPNALSRLINTSGVTVLQVVPTLLRALLQYGDLARCTSLRRVFCGGEPLDSALCQQLNAISSATLVNLYGPAEATIDATYWVCDPSSSHATPPIGRPVANTTVHILDAHGRQVPPGVSGELYLGGAGLARGYLNRPDLTAERFTTGLLPDHPATRLYRTGDLVTLRPDGTLHFIGRADRQIKIRGQRIEIGEVEAVLRDHPDVGEAAVTALPATGGGLELVAFVTLGTTGSVAGLRDHCAERLPAAMVPGRVLALPGLPLLGSGKVDLDRLAALADTAKAPERPYDPPATPEEEEVAAVWSDLLGSPRVGRDDDFFDAGGHSITAMRLVAAMRSRLRRDVSVEDVLGGRTLRAIASRVAIAAPLGDDLPVRGRPPALSPAQRRLWFLDHYSPDAAAAYNITVAERLRGPLNVPALQAALTAVSERQQVLRWRIPDADGEPYAVVDPPAPVPLPVDDLSGLPPEQREWELTDRLATGVSRRFALDGDALWRNRLYRLGPDEHVLAVTAHHAVFDGWSQSLLYQDLAAAYAAALAQRPAPGRPPRLPALPATYADYVAWRAERHAQRAGDDLAWWVSHLEGVPTVLELPADRPRPAEQTFAGAYAGLWLDATTTADLARFARELGATPSAVLLAALGVVVARLTGQPDMVIGSPMVDRRHADFEEMVGFFIEIAPLRLRPHGTASFADHVRASRDELLAALAHPEAPLERIVQAFGLGGQMTRSPLVQVLFNMFNFAAPRLDLAGVSSEPVPVQVPGSPFDLTVYGVERDGRLRIEVVYNADLYDEPRMTALLESLRQVVVQGVAASDTAVRDLELPIPPPDVAPDVPRARAVTVRAPAVTDLPATPTERAVAAVWCEVLGCTGVGANDSFFDSGGSSLAIVAVQRRLSRLTRRDLRVLDLFRYPTVRALAAYLDGVSGGDADAAVERAGSRGATRRDRVRRRVPRRPDKQP